MQRRNTIQYSIIFVCLCLVGCLSATPESATPINIRMPFVSPGPTETVVTVDTIITETVVVDNTALTPIEIPTEMPFPAGLTDELPVMSGICFDAAFDARDQVFVLRSAQDHINFYDLADNSQLCSRPVRRFPFDFSTGRILAGVWSYGRGCTANHEIRNVIRNDDEQRFIIQTFFHTNGDCNYELIRPFWVGIDVPNGYSIDIEIEN